MYSLKGGNCNQKFHTKIEEDALRCILKGHECIGMDFLAYEYVLQIPLKITCTVDEIELF